MKVRVQRAPFDFAAEAAAFGGAGAGAVVTFTGIVRDCEGSLQRMEIEHYPGMTERALTRIAEEASARWGLVGGLIIHRYGPLVPGEAIMMVATSAAHRAEAFAAAEYLMDYLKSRAPFWKKEIRSDGEAWVSARDADEQALTRW
ncbi:molybdopterin synthase subunit MoaE [Rhodovulum imhoffii]|uniref:Molybdopterin synthase catalytic subunit n=1 Tax=Rhodovulum imhoffii TaxID=365340 RepID=A0A2T5BSL3_9RHOB|nr:molybdenum cofactor biosynthesis protein MoaE [Rhodovulum imhoffii]MBK5933019.1 molybdenum cofactor biosynthesis protein MoaE [Rhodovulum imhoffii]PTN02337.1 molybdopterin synthase subunit MoaE [Rhodovulum imhoffii]